MSNINIPLAVKVLRSILTHPEEHDQSSWLEVVDFSEAPEVDGGITSDTDEDGRTTESRTVTIKGMLEGSCGTSACVAGWAALHEGWQVRTTRTCYDGYVDYGVFSISPEGEECYVGHSVDFEVQGRDALELDYSTSNTLFYDTTNDTAPIYLYGLIKGIEDPSFLEVADFLEIPYELSWIDPDDIEDGYRPGEDDLSGFEFVRVLEQILAHIREEYPPLTEEELMAASS